ncbi:MAG: rhomboid family intramembrane serine protease [Planctomycetaceae bacterium]|nr:rhomboid family intramembrane serine protease [Planctomycetaceae bacterium]
MRQLGSFSSKVLADRFCDYLISERISCQVEVEDQSFVLWVLDEDHIEQAREAYQQFQETPEDPKFLDAHQHAEKIRSEQLRQAKQAMKRQIDIRKQWEPPGTSDLLITYLLIAISVVVTLKFQLEGNSFGIFAKLSIAEIHDLGGGIPGSSRVKLLDVKDGEVWRLVSPIFVHMDPLHLLFNMYWMFLFGKLLEPRLGAWRFLLLVLATAICSNLVQYYWAGPMFGGMSGVLYAVFGFTWAKRDWEPQRGIGIDQTTVYLLVGWMFLCLLGFMPVANAAHVSGLVSGYLIAMVRPMYHKLLR